VNNSCAFPKEKLTIVYNLKDLQVFNAYILRQDISALRLAFSAFELLYTQTNLQDRISADDKEVSRKAK